MTSRTCQTTVADCPEVAVARAVWVHDRRCHDHHTTDYCAGHRDRILAFHAAGKGVTCTCGGEHTMRLKEMLPLGYETARTALLEADWRQDGFLELKEAMTDAVTMDDPRDWDIFGSLLADMEPATQPVSPARRACLYAYGAGFIAATFLWLTLVMTGAIH
jgi:hypothetical protein